MGQTTCSRYGDVQMNAEALIRELVGALEANHQWHQDYDDYDGYPDSALENENSAALAKARAYLASGGLA